MLLLEAQRPCAHFHDIRFFFVSFLAILKAHMTENGSSVYHISHRHISDVSGYTEPMWGMEK